MGYDQLRALGFTRGVIAYRVETRRLIAVHHGVYAVGHDALSDRGRMIAAGPGAALSHGTAAYLWKLVPSLPPFAHADHNLIAETPAPLCDPSHSPLDRYQTPGHDAPHLSRAGPGEAGRHPNGGEHW
jgi:hypothetical protein